MTEKVDDAQLTGNDGDSAVTYHEAMDLLDRARVAFERLAADPPRSAWTATLARLVAETHSADSVTCGDVSAYDLASRLMSFARLGRPAGGVDPHVEVHRSNGQIVPDGDLDWMDRCIRLALAFAYDAFRVYEDRVPSQEWPALMARVERAEKAPATRKRIMFVYAVDFASRSEAVGRSKGTPGPPIEHAIAWLLAFYDVAAAKQITPDLASKCVEAWRKSAGQRGKWETLAAACNELGLGGDDGITANSLKVECSKAQKARELRRPVEVPSASSRVARVKKNRPASRRRRT